MSVRPLLIVGAGGFGRETAEMVRTINELRPTWDLLGFLDDSAELEGVHVDGTPVAGRIADVARFGGACLTICTGHPGNYWSRRRIVDRLRLPPGRFATLIHPGAMIPRAIEIGAGTVMLAGVVATTAVRVGAHVAVMPQVVLTHDDAVGDFVTIGAGARVAGRVRVSEGAYIGSGALVRESLTVGRWALVGMGSVVTRNVPAGEVWAGVPARRVRSAGIPDDLLAGSAA